jgi:5-oxopent-3-ene-1,2,5-tricarboxylate decarboxylase/2-hydroxyhepta-2,4-diene-1,7-dioate isomerase
MKRGRIAFQGAIHQVTQAADGRVQLADGRLLNEEEVSWLPPVVPGAVFALGLNYADHAKELAFKAPEVPLAFLKGPNTIVGHRAKTRRPADATYMHYECELAVVIGKTGYQVSKADAMEIVAGYTVANDYAIRDYLENYYRPNLRVKNRDGCTPLGPWLVDAADVPNPMALIATLIEYLTSFMTLNPGDIILTGTPEGLADVKAGDVIETEVEGVCCLINTIVDDATYFAN